MKQKSALNQDLLTSLEDFLSPHLLAASHILDHLPVAVFVCDMQGHIRKYNEQAARLWGRRPAIGDGGEKFCGSFKLYKPDGTFLPRTETPAASCLEDGIPRKDIELMMERPDLTKITVRISIVPLKDSSGNQVGIINCFSDISQEKHTENELFRSRQQLEDYVDKAPIGLHWVDKYGIIKWANAAEMKMLGYSENEYIGHHIAEFHLHKKTAEDILSRLRHNETLVCYESLMVCKDGSLKTVQISSNVYHEDGEFIHTRCFTVDVSEQKKFLQLQKDQEEKQKNILKSLPAAVYTCDKDGYVTFFNDAAAALWGREPEIAVDLWCGSWKILKPDGSPLPLKDCPMARCLMEQRAILGEEIIIIKPTGEKINVLPHPEPIFDKDGKMTGAINMLVDMTEIKKAEEVLRESERLYRELAASFEKELEEKTADLRAKNEALQKSEERYHKMVDEVEDYAIILLDENGIVQNWNKGAEKIKGYHESEIVGQSFQLFYLPEDREKGLPKKLITLAATTGKAVHEGWRIRKNGSRFWGSIVLTAIHNAKNEVIGFSKVTRDLTERKMADDRLTEFAEQLKIQNEELKKSEERYHKMVDEVEDYAIIMLDENGIIRNWNRGAEKIKGYHESEILGRSFEIFYLPEDRERGLHKKLISMAASKGKAIHEGWRIRKDGSRFWGSIVLTALHNNKNEVIGFSKVTRDLTERKIAEDKLNEYTTQLKFQNEQLEQFAYAASHDMKEPLRKILFYHSHLLETTLPQLKEKERDYLNRAVNAAKRMERLINDLLEYSKAASDTYGLEPVDLNEVLDEIMLAYKDTIEEKKAVIKSVKLPVIKGIPFQIRQVFDNIISNALKYHHPDRPPVITIDLAKVNGEGVPGLESIRIYYQISVCDNGIGFEPMYAEKIFELFQRLSAVKYTGTGVGLALCKKIALNHHGTIMASGKSDEGACFDIYLPA